VPFALGVVFAMATAALMAVAFELVLWRPMRARQAGLLQLLLASIGLALVIRSVIQYFWSTEIRVLDVNTTATVTFLGLRIGRMQLIVIGIGFVALTMVGLMLRETLLGKRMRALADNIDLAETAGINTGRVILYTWLLAGALAGLAGVLDASVTSLSPNFGFDLLLPIFAAVILGGIGDAYGALAGGMLLGLVTEWSTLFIDAKWKIGVGFAALLLALIIRPQGIFGRARTI
jgi:neutral amino acid transport system permease protein